MTFNNYRLLSEEDKYIVLWENAIQVADREDSRYRYILYQLNDFYIEIKISHHGTEESLDIFSNESKLYPYLSKIDLDQLEIRSIY